MAGSRKSDKNDADLYKFDRLTVNARGATLKQLRDDAVRQASEYFEFDPSGVTLESGKFWASPYLTDLNGDVLEYRARITVYMKPVEDAEEDSSGAEDGSAGSGKPSLTLVGGTDRPNGPKPPKGSSEFEWDD